MKGAQGGWLKVGFVAPTLLFLIAFNVFPLLYNVYLGFTDAELVGGETRWIGTDNYGRIFADPLYGQALRRTALFVVCAVGLELMLGLTLALALQRSFRGKGVVLTTLLVPMMLSPAVMGL